MSTMGRSCVNTIKRSRQNVAIATQVLSPSAIGGSLRGQRRLKHFGPPDDDEEEFISYRKRAAWKKLGCYGFAIATTILILMGIILIVGYLQTTNKSNNMVHSRSVKLVQKGKPISYVYSNSKTTPDPPSVEPTFPQEFSPTTLHSSFLQSYTKGDSSVSVPSSNHDHDDSNDEMYYSTSGESESAGTTGSDNSDYAVNYNEETNKKYNEENGNDDHQEPPLVNSHSSHRDHHDNRDKEEDETPESHSYQETSGKELDNEEESESADHKLENELHAHTIEKESVLNDVNGNNDDWKSTGIVNSTNSEDIAHYTTEKNDDQLPTKEKALPPNESSVFFEIPIYTNNKTSVGFLDSSEQNDFIEESDPVEEQFMPLDDLKSENNITKDNTQDVDNPEEEVMIDENNNSDVIQMDYDKHNGKWFNNEQFSQTILHTSLFHLDDDKDTKRKPGSTAIIIEDRDLGEPATFVENHNSYHDHLLNKQNRTRNHKVKILKNDKVMNMKATYAPEGLKQSLTGNRLQEPDKITDVQDSSISREPTLPEYNRNDNGARSRNETSEWKLRLRTNKSRKHHKANLENVKNVSLDNVNFFDHPYGASSEEQGELSTLKPYNSTIAEKPRSLSSTSSFFPNFESLINAILSNVQQGSNKKSETFQQQKHPVQLTAPSDFGSSYAKSLNQFLPASSPFPTPTLEQDPSLFRKRTFNSEHDIFDFPSTIQDASPPQAENYFDRLLGQFPTAGSIGSPTVTGASLMMNNFRSPIFPATTSTISSISPYDINASNNNDAPQLSPGIIPLDLASSFIQAGLPKSQYSPQPTQATPYGTHNFYDNYGDFSAFSYPNFQSKPNSNAGLDIGSLTTATGHPPTYNSISQGIHLLNLISGTIPSTYYHDQVYPHSNQVQTTPANFQNDGLTSTPSFHFNVNTPTTTNSFQQPATPFNGNHQELEFHGAAPAINSPGSSPSPHPPPPPFSYNSFDYYHPQASNANGHGHEKKPSLNLPLISRALALKSDRDALEKFLQDDDNDQEPSASSFSQNILTTLKIPKSKQKSTTNQETTTAGSIITLMTKPKTKTTSVFTRTPTKTHSNPKSFSFEILPQKNLTSQNYFNPSSANQVMFDDNTIISLANEEMYPSFEDMSTSRSRKKSSANLYKPWKAQQQRLHTTATSSKHIPNETTIYSMKTSMSKSQSKSMHEKKTKKAVNAAGLKSGFFT